MNLLLIYVIAIVVSRLVEKVFIVFYLFLEMVLNDAIFVIEPFFLLVLLFLKSASNDSKTI
ncbi:hypothetical protein BD770DRAFT_398266 [Pilaira anomala]|nr:hypothetical protein BD770DRAFT_398266 [Pilaira anomala]